MSFPKYENYKDSGVEWLGEVPAHWNVMALRRCLIDHRQGYYSESDYVDSGVKLLRITDLQDFGKINFEHCPKVKDCNELKPFLLEESDFVFARTGGAGTFGLVDKITEPVAYASYLIRFRFQNTVNPKFLSYFFLSSGFRAAVRQNIHGGVNQNIHAEDIKNQFSTFPLNSEQVVIAEFLDRETAKIDELVEEQQRLIELLKEKRQAVISHAVTHGLNPHVKLKPSGIEWLGDVPAHWEVKRIKHLSARISSGKTPSGGSEVYVYEGVTFLRSQNVYDEGLYLDDVVFITETVDEAMASSRVSAGDILLNITGASIGRSCLVPQNLGPANVNQHVCVIRLKDPSKASFVGWVFKSKIVKDQIDYAQNGAAREGLNFAQIGEIILLLPPVVERETITAFLEQQTIQFDTLTAKAQRAIDLLQERRTALISAAVTGKIDVRQFNNN